MLARRRQALPGLRIDKARERAVQSRLILAAERALEAQLARTIQAAGRRAAQAYREHGAAAAARAAAPLAGDVARVLRPSIAQVARTFGARVIQAPKSAHAFETKAAFEDLDRAINSHVRWITSDRVQGVSYTLQQLIRRVIEQGIADNLGEEAIAEAIVEATAGEIAMARARRIARTEVHNAAMFGQQAAAEASPLAFDKVWLATEDSRTRESHAKANDQRVGLDEEFVLDTPGGPVHLTYPGDLDGPPGETINCRCVCLYEPKLVDAPHDELVNVEVNDRPIDLDPPGEDEPAPEPLERDIEARPFERAESVHYAAGTGLNLQPDGTPATGSTVSLIGPNTFYGSPDAPEVDREIASNPAFLGFRRPVLWRLTIPAGPAFLDGLVTPGGAGITINSGVGRFALLEMRVTSVTRTTWGHAAPKDYIDVDRFDPYLRDIVEQTQREAQGLDRHLGTPIDSSERVTADQLAALLARQIYGVRLLGESAGQDGEDGVPQSVLRALIDTSWTKPALAGYLQRLIDGSIRDEASPGEPDEQARLIVVEADLVLASAIPEEGA